MRAVALLAAVLIAAPAAAQSPALSSIVEGQVVDARDGVPLRRARVRVVTRAEPALSVLTDDEGRFRIEAASLAGGSIRVTKAGYVAGVAELPDTAPIQPVRFALSRSAAITGVVVDEIGAPAWLAYVTARATGPGADALPDGLRRFFVRTDRLGEYRLGGLPAATYEVRAVFVRPDQPNNNVEAVLFGSADDLLTSPTTTTVTLRPGDEAQTVDFTIAGLREPCPAGPSRLPAPDRAAAAIAGRVTAPDGRPLACALVGVEGANADVPGVYTDAQGRYEIDGLEAGTYVVRVMHPGSVPLRYGQRTPRDADEPLTLRAAERRGDVDLVLPRFSIVAGTIVDEHGEPVEGVSVWPVQVQRSGDLVTTMSSVTPSVTDDRGQFRIAGVRPGRYIVAAMMRGVGISSEAGGRGYATVYYPGTTYAALAQTFTIDAGEDVTALTFAFAPVRTMTIRGRAIDASGRPFPGRVLAMPSVRSGGLPVESWDAPIDASGDFAIRNVPAGDYVLKAFNPANQTLGVGIQFVSVLDNDPPPVQVAVSAGALVRGRIIADGTADVNFGAMQISAITLSSDYTAPIGTRDGVFGRSENNTFFLSGPRGPVRLIASTPACADCYVKAARINGVDALHATVDVGVAPVEYRDAEIVISDAGGAVEGRALDERGRAARGYTVVAIPLAREMWFAGSPHMKRTQTDGGGAYRLTGLAPGDYAIVAVSRLELTQLGGELTDPSVLESLIAQARTIVVTERDRQTLDVSLIRR